MLANIFSGGASTIWTLAPELTVPLFDAGANQAELDYAKAEFKQALANYEYTVQTAFTEVADALARRATIVDQLNAQQQLVASAQRSYDLSLARYQNGVDSFQDTLSAQRTLYAAKQSLISTRLSDLSNRITLYRVLGGGFSQQQNAAPDT